MYPYKLVITGSKVCIGEYWRINRLHRVLGYAQALADIDDNENYYKKLKMVEDFKGLFTVEWKKQPTKLEIKYLQNAWDSIVADYECDPIRHKINGMEQYI
jgi:hypothetical protein